MGLAIAAFHAFMRSSGEMLGMLRLGHECVARADETSASLQDAVGKLVCDFRVGRGRGDAYGRVQRMCGADECNCVLFHQTAK